MRDLSTADLTQLRRRQGNYRDRFPVECSEFNLVTRAIAMDEHHGTNVSAREAILREVAIENHIVKFVDHRLSFSGDTLLQSAVPNRFHL
jgi:hypothetical protein